MNFCHRVIGNSFSFLTTTVFSLSIILFAFASIANAAPEDQEVFTNFASINTNLGEEFSIGTSPNSATFSGSNAFSGVAGIGELYHSENHAWMVGEASQGTIQFETNAAVVEFWANARNSANGDTIISAFDDDNTLIDTITITPAGPFQLVSFTGDIDHLLIENFANGGNDLMNGIDDFGYTPVAVPEPASLLLVLCGLPIALCIHRKRKAR